jgi:quercetin dioxygenase-like cupin family protein
MTRYVTAFASAAVALLISVPAFGQDPLKVDPQHYRLIEENASVRIIRVNYPVGAKSVMHSHPDALFISLAPSKARFTTPDGKFQDMEMANDSGLYTPAGTHVPSNTGTTAVDGILVEFKSPAPGKATLPASRPDMSMKLLAEGPRAVAYRVTSAPTFSEPAGTKHDFDIVVIALGSGALSLALEGKPAKTSWTRGDVVLVGRGVAHEARNTGGKSADSVNIMIR